MKRFGIGLALALGLMATSASAQEDVGSQVDQICCGSNCCLIGGTCFTSGEASPDDACMVCDPSGSNTSFTNTCGSPDMGGGDGGDDGDDGGCSAAGGPAGAYGFALIGAALAFVRRRRR
ncbi:MAG: hypothetical protein JJ863_11280 [Deltaproteobacteria bacterium]|nr:hypothetical protein [Deltaproteobacteria bacterium]